MQSLAQYIVHMVAIAALASTLTHCSSQNEKLSAEDVNVDCFTQLFPHRIVNGRITKLAFQNGQCAGNLLALNKTSFQQSVLVSHEGLNLTTVSESILTVQNGIVFAQGSSGIKRIGHIHPETFAIAMDPGVEFSLMIHDQSGAARQWSLDQGGFGETQKESIVVNIPF